jgi:hypothetical protein
LRAPEALPRDVKSEGEHRKRIGRVEWIVFVLSLAILFAAVVAWGPSRELDQDAPQYVAIAKSLATGNGYKNTYSPFPDAPAIDRMPGWPVMLAVSRLVVPNSISDAAVARFTGAFCLALVGLVFTRVAGKLGATPLWAAIAGFGAALSPPLVFIALSAMSEVSFLLVLSAGLGLLLEGGRRWYFGAILLGLAPLIRTNFVLLPFVLIGLLVLAPQSRAVVWRHRVEITIALGLFLLPTVAWLLRNAAITGRFPLMSSIEGETLYGGNNDVVANQLSHWGYWIMPNDVPGEKPMLDRVKDGEWRGFLDLNDYYHKRGIEWIRGHGSALPRLVLGKLIRGFVPLPWVPGAAAYIAFGYRFLLDLLYIVLARWWWPALDRRYLLIAAAMFLVNLVTIVIYWGVYRFTHTSVEIFFLPPIALGLSRLMSRRGPDPAN